MAVLLIGGDKTGDDRFYDWMVPLADAILDAYLDALGGWNTMVVLRDFNDLTARLPDEVRERARHRANQMRAEMLLAEIRKQQSLTQAEVAVALGIAEPSPTKVDGADDMPLSTLRQLVASMGLQLDVAVVLADGRRVNLTQSQPHHATGS